MADLDDRRRGLEEEYFRKKDQEAIEKMREKMRISAEAKAAGESLMRCPRCAAALAETKFEEVLIDRCDNCGGIWLDSGELAQLIKKDSDGWFKRLWTDE